MLENPQLKQTLPDMIMSRNAHSNRHVQNALPGKSAMHNIIITGPNKLDRSQNSSLAITLVSEWKKSPNLDEKKAVVKSGTIIVSSHETGDIFFTPQVLNPSQTFQVPPGLPEPFGQANISSNEYTYSVVTIDLVPGRDLPVYNGNFSVFAVFETHVSNIFEGCIINAVDRLKGTQGVKESHSTLPTLSDKKRILLSHMDKSPQPPEYPLIRLNVPKEKEVEPGKSFILNGSFCFGESEEHRNNTFIIYVILTGKTYKTPDCFEICIPREFCHLKNNLLQGYFAFDLMERFFRPDKNAFYIPENLCVTIVHKNLIIAPVALSLVVKES